MQQNVNHSPENPSRRQGQAGWGSRLSLCLAGCSLAALCVVGCTGADSGDTDPVVPELPVLSLSAEPTLEIGMVDGDEDYLFQRIVSTVHLPSGGIAISDAGAAEVSVYASDGTFLRRWGGRGEGPGEFRALSRIYSGGEGAILALDAWTGRVSVFDTLGNFSHQVSAEDLSADTIFPLDVWLYGLYWVDGALDASTRETVRGALDALSPPPAGEHRLVRVGRDRRLWILEPGVAPQGRRTWTVVSPQGAPEAVALLPVRFDPMEISAASVTGRWLGQDDVNFVRSYALTSADTSASAPDWYHRAASEQASDELDAEFMTRVREAIMRLASAQEIHYAGHATYAPIVDSLSWERPEGVAVDIVTADARGWAAVFTHPGLGRLCGLGYGAAVPPGWPAGGIVCGPSAASTRRGEG